MSVGPIEIVVLAFPGSRFTGDIRPELEQGSSAFALAFEHAWMLPIRDAVVASGQSCWPTSTFRGPRSTRFSPRCRTHDFRTPAHVDTSLKGTSMRRRNGRPGLMRTMARTAVIAGTATAVSGSVGNKRQVRAGQEAELADEEFTAMKAKLLGL